MGHAFLAPSSASVWAHCAGYPTMAALVPDPKTDQSKEGDAAHFVAQHILEDCRQGMYGHLVLEQYLGETDPAGTIITQDMIDGAMMYVDEIALVMEVAGWEHLWVETHVDTDIHAECKGTPDAFFYDAVNKILYVWDFKYGHGDVDAFENEQLLCYYSGVSDMFLINGDDDQKVQVQFMIVQPRCYTPRGPIKTWEVIGSDLRGHLNTLRVAATACMAPDAQTKSGNHCRHCPARYVCESNRQQAVDGVSYLNAVAPTPLSDGALSVELATLQNVIKDLKYRVEALQDEADSRISAGKLIPNFSRQPTQTRRKFNAEIEVVNIIGQAQKVSLIKEPELVSPAEAERLLRTSGMKPKDIKAALAGLIDSPSSGTKIVMDKGVEARRIFSKPL